MLLRRLLASAYRQRRLVSGLLSRYPLLRNTALGARLRFAVGTPRGAWFASPRVGLEPVLSEGTQALALDEPVAEPLSVVPPAVTAEPAPNTSATRPVGDTAATEHETRSHSGAVVLPPDNPPSASGPVAPPSAVHSAPASAAFRQPPQRTDHEPPETVASDQPPQRADYGPPETVASDQPPPTQVPSPSSPPASLADTLPTQVAPASDEVVVSPLSVRGTPPEPHQGGVVLPDVSVVATSVAAPAVPPVQMQGIPDLGAPVLQPLSTATPSQAPHPDVAASDATPPTPVVMSVPTDEPPQSLPPPVPAPLATTGPEGEPNERLAALVQPPPTPVPALATDAPPLPHPHEQPVVAVVEQGTPDLLLAPPPTQVAQPTPGSTPVPPVRVAVPVQAVPEPVDEQEPFLVSEPSTVPTEPEPPLAPSQPPPTAPTQRSRRGRFEESSIRTGSSTPTSAQPAPTQRGGEPKTAAELFSTPAPERTSLDWGRLLFEATGPQPRRPAPAPRTPPVPAPLAVTPSPTVAANEPESTATLPRQEAVAGTRTMPPPPPLAESTRRFLQPLVGIDPVDVAVHRGAAADEVAAQHQADAVTIGEEVFLSAGNDDERDPATRALIAHELTHVVRRRQPRFVPPITSDLPTGGESEEAVARTVEARVRRDAQALDAQPNPSEPPSPAVVPQTSPAQEPGDWGGLPAPWEPMPSWFADSWSAPPASPAPGGPTEPAPTFAPAAESPPVVARAALNRAVEDAAPPPAAPAPAQQGNQQELPPQDVDALARQVYAVLRQRLAAERRRLS